MSSSARRGELQFWFTALFAGMGGLSQVRARVIAQVSGIDTVEVFQSFNGRNSSVILLAGCQARVNVAWCPLRAL